MFLRVTAEYKHSVLTCEWEAGGGGGGGGGRGYWDSNNTLLHSAENQSRIELLLFLPNRIESKSDPPPPPKKKQQSVSKEKNILKQIVKTKTDLCVVTKTAKLIQLTVNF